MARKFLYFIAVIIVLLIVGAIALAIWSREATQIALVPRGEFVERAPLEANAYQDPAMWYSRPGIGVDDPARYQPAIAEGAADPATESPSPENPAAERGLASPTPLATGDTAPGEPADPAATPAFAVFFVHPTSYIPLALGAKTDWNATLGDADTEARARLFLKGMASAFNRADEIWAPKYRQAVAGAFLTDKVEADRAIAMAYRDVAQAFDVFLASVDKDKPIVLAGHSQGSIHVLKLLQERVAGTPLQSRIAAVYAPGWPISVEHDLPSLPVPACAAPDQAGCLLGWSTFTDSGDPALIMERYKATAGFDGEPRGEGPILCVNPLTGAVGGEAPASANLGTLLPDESLTSASLLAGAVPARCDERGLLLIGDPPDVGPGVLPDGNYHVYDIVLFWKNLQEDVLRRVDAWTAAQA